MPQSSEDLVNTPAPAPLPTDPDPNAATGLVSISLPVAWTFAALVAGLLAGAVLDGTTLLEPAVAIAGPVGSLWLRALQMTIIPLVAALLVTGVAQMALAARAGATARWMLGLVVTLLFVGASVTAIVMPALLRLFPVPGSAGNLMGTAGGEAPELPALGDFITSLVAPNLVAAAAETAMLPLTLFFAVFALAVVRLAQAQREVLLRFFHALANAMLVIIGWVLWVAPVGVFALALGVSAQAKGGAFATLAHYILTVSAMGLLVVVNAYLVAWLLGRVNPVRFAAALLPAQAVAVSTQSSLASLPAMLDSARRLSVREGTADFVLPLAVAIFRATSPAMNLAVVIYVAAVAGVAVTPVTLLAGIAVAFVISVGSVSLPGSISFVVSVGPIAHAMGVPVEPLALLVAVEMLPDIIRTVGNVTMNVAVASAVDRQAGGNRATNSPAVEEAVQTS